MRGTARPRVSRLAVLVLTLAAAGLATPLSAAPRVDVVVTGLEVPWALAFAPDGRLFVTERPGRVRVVTDGRLAAEPVASLAVRHVGESGLMGLTLDPDVTRTGHLYVCYTTRRQGASVNRVARLTLHGDRAGDEQVILDDMPAATIHDGCRLKFGPDGRLYVTMGDAAQPQNAQRADVRAGKILRINADGSIPDDNPFRGSPVWTLGHRNPQGLAWDDQGRLWAAEHGQSGHDEINLILPGRNYGWPDIQGSQARAGLVTPALHSGAETWAPSGMAYLGGSLYVAGLRGQRLVKATPGADGRLTGVTELLRGAWGRLRDVVAGPDGALYAITSNRDGRGMAARDDDRILRVMP